MDIYEESLALHKKTGGKLGIKSKVPLNDKHDLSLAYTPGVGAVSSAIGKDAELAYEYTLKGNSVAVVSDGSSVLGLGNLGAAGAIPVMEGKAILFKEFANIDAFPICLDTQNVDEIVNTVKHIAPVFGGVNLEDISAPRCFEVEKRLREELSIPVMHDDQHGTATVVLAAMINAVKLRFGIDSLISNSRECANSLAQIRVVFSGAGAAGTAVLKMLLGYGFKDVVVCDSQGAIYKGRPELTDEKLEIANITNPRNASGGLSDVVRGADVFIGVSKAGLLTPDMVKTMAAKPIIFALANPVPEIMPDVAKEAGAYIIATGRSDFPNQINNVLAFPGIFRGALDNKIKQFKPEMFVAAAKALAAYVKSPTVDQLLPSPLDKSVVAVVANAIR